MYTRCLVCATPFEANEELQHLPHGRRLAFDPKRGRLWAVCRTCRSWSLTPIEDRWEALEELEKLATDRAKLLSQTENISLLRAGQLEVVRVGKAERTEEAWWRYGRELTSRKRSWDKLGVAGTLAAGAVVAGGWATGGMTMLGVWLVMGHGSETVRDGARWLRFGSSAWRGEGRCTKCDHLFRSIPFRERGALGLFPTEETGKIELVARCPKCGEYRDAGLHLRGQDAERTLRRVLAYHHFAGASEQRVVAASRLIQEAGSPRDLTRIVIKDGRRLGDLQRTGGIALEIAANEASEQHLLEMELAGLEAHWRREEELASIIDGELTPLPFLEQMRRLVPGAGG
ncbi:MAG: hypothetical protein O2958_07000 [Gemmatimonadetes bacterium]|nr:hypothetical protein [Gemmatimonadota bacterium]MDA1103801.1 hypothetical protein [Gemmatimonadota bacterium]